MRIFRSTLRKLVRRPATWVSLGLMVALLALILLSVAASLNQLPDGRGRLESMMLITFPTAYPLLLTFILGLGGLFAVLYAASIAGSEWGWGTLKMAIARGESRWRYSLLTFAAIALALGVALVVLNAIGVLLTLLSGRIAGVDSGDPFDADVLRRLPEQVVRAWIAICEQAAIGYAIATVARSQLAGIGAGIGIYFGEQFATLFLPDVVRYLPFHVANLAVDVAGALGPAASAAAGAAADSGTLGPNDALLITIAWLLGGLAVAAAFTDRAEIPG